MSLHFLFRSEDHLMKAIADPAVVKAVREMIDETVQGAHVLAVMTLGLRNMYSKREIKKIEDIKGMKVRVQATPTEDTMFPAYGAQTVHMPFGNVYTSLQTGVVDVAENGVNVYLVNKHYEVAPVLSMTEHEANNNLIWISDKLWSSLTAEQKGWVQAAADEVAKVEPAQGPRPRASVGDQAQGHGRQGRDRCRQVGLHQGGNALSRKDGQGSRAACGEDPAADQRGEIAPCARAPEKRMADDRSLVLQRQRQLKWRALDWLESLLMMLCGATLIAFCTSVVCDIVTRTIGAPWLWLQEVTSTFFIYGIFIGAAVATRRNDHLFLAAVGDSFTGRPRLPIETLIRLVVISVGDLPDLVRLHQFPARLLQLPHAVDDADRLALCRDPAQRCV